MMMMKLLVAVLAVTVLILVKAIRKTNDFVKNIAHFMYINSCAYKELADSVTSADDLAEFRARFAEMKNYLREQCKAIGAPVDEWDKEMQ